MNIYYLYNSKRPFIPFYIGITNNPVRRLKQHKNKWIKHKPYITSKNQIKMHVMYDTGDNEYSKTLAEKIEIQLIKYYNTVNLGSNKVYDINEYFKTSIHKKAKVKKEGNELELKRQKTREKKQHKKFKKIIQLIKDDPMRYSIQELVDNSKFVSVSSLNYYVKKYHNISFNKWLSEYQRLWLKYLEKRYNHRKKKTPEYLDPIQYG